jgi:hypothetical protein
MLQSIVTLPRKVSIIMNDSQDQKQAKRCSVVVFFCVCGCTWLHVLYAFVYFCTLYILIVRFMYSYNYACSVLYPD